MSAATALVLIALFPPLFFSLLCFSFLSFFLFFPVACALVAFSLLSSVFFRLVSSMNPVKLLLNCLLILPCPLVETDVQKKGRGGSMGDSPVYLVLDPSELPFPDEEEEDDDDDVEETDKAGSQSRREEKFEPGEDQEKSPFLTSVKDGGREVCRDDVQRLDQYYQDEGEAEEIELEEGEGAVEAESPTSAEICEENRNRRRDPSHGSLPCGDEDWFQETLRFWRRKETEEAPLCC